MNERFEISARFKNTSLALILIGVITLVIGGIALLGSADAADKTRFWIVLLLNSVFFLLMSATCIFIQAVAALAHGGWIVAYRRIPEAIGSGGVLVFGLIALVVLLLSAFVFQIDGHNPIYAWVTDAKTDHIIAQKTAFLNPTMFVVFSILTIGSWVYFGYKLRGLSLAQEQAPKNSTRLYWKYFKWSAGFLVVYALTQMSVTPWLWIMSIDAHWYSTMFSWYTFASAFVSGISLMLIWVIYLKNQGYLQLVTTEHVHDLGKFQFAFSIFWAYVWFAQYMLIWYSNIPEETTYFKMRQQGPYSLIWYSVFIINFIMPILVLMSRSSKRNYFTVSFMAMVIIFGHWLDFYIMMIPGPLGAHWHLSWYELGMLLGFAGIMMLTVGRLLSKASLVTHNNVLLKETVIHQS